MNQGRRRRAITAVLLAGLFAFAAPAVAQDAQTQGPPDENGTIGPRELQKFELPGTRTNPAYQTPDTPSDRTPATEPPKKVVTEAPAPAPEPQPAAAAPAENRPAVRVTPPAPATATRGDATPRPERTATVSPAEREPAAAPGTTPARPTIQQPSLQAPAPIIPPSEPPATAPSASSTGFSWSYLLFVLLGFLLAIGTMRVLQTRQKPWAALGRAARPRARPPAPEPALLLDEPAPPISVPSPPKRAPRPSFASTAMGDVVGVQIRPWLQLEFKPDRAAATLTEAAVQYELAISNVGNAVARNVRIEARMFNAGAEQEREIKDFFASPVDEGRSAQVLAIPPRKGARLRNVVAMPKELVREINVQGRRLFIPLVAFNVVYEWGEGKSGQTSMSYLVGREPDTPSDRMGAFRLDLGPRVYRSVAQRPSEVAVRV